MNEITRTTGNADETTFPVTMVVSDVTSGRISVAPKGAEIGTQAETFTNELEAARYIASLGDSEVEIDFGGTPQFEEAILRAYLADIRIQQATS